VQKIHAKHETKELRTYLRPSDKRVDLDFEITHSKYTHMDVKTPPNPLKPDKYGKITSNVNPNYVGFNIGKKIVGQQSRFCNMPTGPKSPENVMVVVDLRYLERPSQQLELSMSLKEGLASMNCKTTDGIKFINGPALP
jgi:hypothetical protein